MVRNSAAMNSFTREKDQFGKRLDILNVHKSIESDGHTSEERVDYCHHEATQDYLGWVMEIRRGS